MLAHADAVAERLAQAGQQVAERVSGRALDAACPRVSQRARFDRADGGRAAARGPRRTCRSRSSRARPPTTAPPSRTATLHVAVCFQDAAVERHEPSGTERHELGEEPMLAMLSRVAHPLAGEERVALRALADQTWTAPSRDHLGAPRLRGCGLRAADRPSSAATRSRSAGSSRAGSPSRSSPGCSPAGRPAWPMLPPRDAVPRRTTSTRSRPPRASARPRWRSSRRSPPA